MDEIAARLADELRILIRVLEGTQSAYSLDAAEEALAAYEVARAA